MELECLNSVPVTADSIGLICLENILLVHLN